MCTTYIYMYVCICVHIYIYMILWKTKPKNFAGILCSALQRKEMWLRFPFASLKVWYQPNIFALPTRQSQPSLLESPFHRQDARCEPRLSCWRLRVLGEREANVTPKTGGPCHVFQSGLSPMGELFCSLPCLATEISPFRLKPESARLGWFDKLQLRKKSWGQGRVCKAGS